MDLSKYPVTTPFGYVPGYTRNNGFHNGIDYGLPMDTPVVVNGVEIARSNNTGASTGPHLHIGKYAGGAAQNPGVGNGASFGSAVVFDVGKDAVNGNYVRITADGALWNYLHLADGSIKVRAGQVLNGGLQGEVMATDAQIDEDISLIGQVGYGTAPPDEVFSSDRPLLKNNFIEGTLQKLRNIDQDPNSAKNRLPAVQKQFEQADASFKQVYSQLQQAEKDRDSAIAQLKAAGGTYTEADRTQAGETNAIAKAIQAGVNKLLSFWKV